MTEPKCLVYPWIASMARGNELKFSLRSVDANFEKPVDVWIIGDRPEWYVGNWLPCPVYDARLCLPRQDRAKKMLVAMADDRVAETFVWMMDDIYFIRPIALSDLRRQWTIGTMTPEKLADWKPVREWTRQKKLTFEALYDNGKTLYDFCTHLPHVYEKSKLRLLCNKYGLPDSPYVDDLLYENEFYPYNELPLNCQQILYRESRRPSAAILRQKMSQDGIRVFNHVDRAFSPDVEQVLTELFPKPSQWEKGGKLLASSF